MANTTNFNWETPDDTDLVKDGAAAIRTLGNSIDTSFVDLKGGTTGQVLSKASNTDLDFTWTAGGDITEVQAGVGISIASGTGPIPVITNSSTDLITTAGDILYGTAADTVARLGIGTASQVLSVNSGATAPEWKTISAGGLTQISSTTLTGASITLSSIPQTYVNLLLVVQNYKPANDAAGMFMRVNGETGTFYRVFDDRTNNAPANGDSVRLSQENDNSVAQGLTTVRFPNYANTTTFKWWEEQGLTNNATTTANIEFQNSIGVYYKIDAISSITIFNSSGNFTSGTAILYGEK